MKATELINKIQELIDLHGDCEVYHDVEMDVDGIYNIEYVKDALKGWGDVKYEGILIS